MSYKGNGGASETEPLVVQQTLEESSLRTREQGYIRPRLSRQERRKLTKAVKEQVNVFQAKSETPAHTIGEYPKAKSNSSSRVKGLQLMTSVSGVPLGKNQRRRSRARKRKISSYGSMDTGQLSHVKRFEMSQQFPSSQILDRIPLSGAKLKSLSKNIPGSWLEPGNDMEKQDFLCKANALAVSEDHIKRSEPIFYCGDGSSKIDGIPNDSIVRNVTSDLLVIDTVHGFKFPFSSSGQEDILLVRRTEALKYETADDHARLLLSFKVLSNKTPNKGIVRGKKRIVAFQQGSNGKYLTPGICPHRASPGTSVRALMDLDPQEHDALFRYVRKCENLAINSMSLETTRGFNMAKKMFPFKTFPGRGGHDGACHAFSSIATALNVCLNSHTDNDSFYGVVTNLDADPLKFPQLDDDVALYFTFPTLGLAIALRPGDILVFNPAVYHSVSSRRNPNQDVWCTSLYTKNAVVGGNDNSQEISQIQKDAIDIARSMINN
jgi:hypothetical protein